MWLGGGAKGLSKEALFGRLLLTSRERKGFDEGLIPWTLYHTYPPNILEHVSHRATWHASHIFPTYHLKYHFQDHIKP